MNLLGSALTSIKPRKDDTLIDRLNYYYSSMIIIGLSITLTAKQYVGQPIQCWVPAEFSKAWEQYAENYCFVYNTYWVKPDEEIPRPVDERVNRQLLYYQWVPFLMALEAGFFYFPVLFWAQTNGKSGLNIAAMVRAVELVRESGSETPERRKTVLAVSQHLEESVRLRQIRRQSAASRMGQLLKFGILSGTFVTNMYLLTKMLFVLNIIGQFWMMNYFLGQNDPAWGARILSDVISGNNWELSGNFPRVALCDFTVRTMSNVQRYSIQCVLVLNMFNEKIFLFLYWWLLLVGAMTALDTLQWAVSTRISARRISYMKRFVPVLPDEDYLFREFCDKTIGADGTMLLRMVSANSNELFTQDVLLLLWEAYRAEAQLRQVLAQKEAQRRQSLASRKATGPRGRASLIGRGPNLESIGSKSSSGNFTEENASVEGGGGWEAQSEVTVRQKTPTLRGEGLGLGEQNGLLLGDEEQRHREEAEEEEMRLIARRKSPRMAEGGE